MYEQKLALIATYLLSELNEHERAVHMYDESGVLQVSTDRKTDLVSTVAHAWEFITQLDIPDNHKEHPDFSVFAQEARLSHYIISLFKMIDRFDREVKAQKNDDYAYNMAKKMLVRHDLYRFVDEETRNAVCDEVLTGTRTNLRFWDYVPAWRDEIRTLCKDLPCEHDDNFTERLNAYLIDYHRENLAEIEQDLILQIHKPTDGKPSIATGIETTKEHWEALLAQIYGELSSYGLDELADYNNHLLTDFSNHKIVTLLIQRADAANKILHSMAVINIIKMKVNAGLTNMSIAHTTEISSPFSVSLPEQLRTPKAIRLLKVAMENDLLADDLTPIISMNKAAILASVIGKILDINPLWNIFEELWHIPDLARKYSNTKNLNYFADEVKNYIKLLTIN